MSTQPPPHQIHTAPPNHQCTTSSVRGEISGNHQLYDPNNPNTSNIHRANQPNQHYHGNKPLQFQEQPLPGVTSPDYKMNGRMYSSFFGYMDKWYSVDLFLLNGLLYYYSHNSHIPSTTIHATHRTISTLVPTGSTTPILWTSTSYVPIWNIYRPCLCCSKVRGVTECVIK